MKTATKELGPVPLECGLVMPISAIDGCSPGHWAEVREFLIGAIHEIDQPRFFAKLVSEEADVGMILRRIVQNVYKSDIIVCDVSGKNANVMFELGMRLAFDKPVVIVKDDKTDYSFDTSIIEHLEYPRDLRYPLMVEFKRQLQSKIIATVEASRRKEYEGFLKNFGTFTVATLEEKKGSFEEVMMQQMAELHKNVALLQRPPTLAVRAGGLVSLDELRAQNNQDSVEFVTPSSLTVRIPPYTGMRKPPPPDGNPSS